MYSIVNFNRCIQSFNYHHNKDIELIHHPPKFPCFFVVFTPARGNNCCLPPYHLSYNWNHTILTMAYFIQHNVFGLIHVVECIGDFFFILLTSIPLNGYIKLYPFLSRRDIYQEHLCKPKYSFLWINTYDWDCWLK